MPVTQIKELRILPPLAIARFGSSPVPLENYETQIVDPLGFRKIVSAPTLIVDDATGAITQETVPDPNGVVRFRDAQGRVRPLAPFLEVWARFEERGMLEPLTKEHLKDLGLDASALRWSVQAANIKVFRRTGDPRDKVIANLQIGTDTVGPDALHRAFPLIGQCKNFKLTDAAPGFKTIPLGTVRYVRPTDKFPEIRFRFTPASGKVYGTRAGDPLITDDVYAGITALPAPPNGPWSAPFAGTWDRYWIGAPGSPPVTAPGDIFQGQIVGATKVSDGYFDDTCDGIVQVSLRVGSEMLTAYARFMSGVPDFAPDSSHVRTIADDLEQMAFGPDVAAPTTPEEEKQLQEDVVNTIRRAYETVRLMNTSVQNGDQNIGGVPRNGNNMPGQETGYGRAFEPVFETASGRASYKNALAQHQKILQMALASPSLKGAFRGISIVRTYANVADLRTRERRRMPAMMRGSDGLELALTRRQYAKLALAAATTPAAPPHEAALAATSAVTAPPPVVLPLGRLAPRTKSVQL
jgi:hypothetical protein